MKWTKYTIDTTTEAIDFISDMLSEIGIEGIEINDNVPITEEEKHQMFIDILPELDEDDGTAQISFYVDVTEDIETTLGTYGHLYPNSNFQVADKLNGVIDFEPAKQNFDTSPRNQFTVDYLRRTEKKKCNESAMEK